MARTHVLLSGCDGPIVGRTALRAAGPDARRFLQGLLTADIDALKPGMASAAALLTVKGKIVWDAVVAARGDDELVLLVPTEIADEAQAKLDKHIIMDDVEITRLDGAIALAWDTDGAALQPPAAGEVYAVTYPAPGLIALGDAATDAAVVGARADAAAFEAHRLLARVPAWGREVVPDRFPPEVGFVQAVSYDKGCYLGQEPLARIHARGSVNWVMVGVKGGEGRAPTPGSPIALTHPERDKAGHWTSAGVGDAVPGLAIVHRALATPGTVVHAEGAELTVVTGPVGDDPGL